MAKLHNNEIEGLWSTPWPAIELENVNKCPVCGSMERSIFNSDLVDDIFFVAPGRWIQKQCLNCSSVYLDPRPDAENIGKAYGIYYTHSTTANLETSERLSGITKVKRLISNGYRNQRYDTCREPALKLGYWITKLLFHRRQPIDAQFRYLPKHDGGQKLLDIGCGNGDFLMTAKEAGWEAYGIDPDPKAIESAKSKYLDVKLASVKNLTDSGDKYEAITLSHVIEHVHDPKQFIDSVFELLKPQGFIYIDTPNISSYGAKYFRTHWRGHECPRHITIFNSKSLEKTLLQAGFENISFKRRPGIVYAMYLKSHRISQGYSPYDEAIKLPFWMWLKVLLLFPAIARQEFITVTATRPK